MKYIKRILLAGFLVWFPLIVTVVVIRYIVELLNNLFSFIPQSYQFQNLIGFKIPGFGIIIAVVIIFITGIVVTNYLGKKLVDYGESILAHIPLVRSVYKVIKQITNSFTTSTDSFKYACLIEYPKKDIWTLAFITKITAGEVQYKTGVKVVNVFVPTTPNPTSGFLLMIPEKDIIQLEMKPEDAIKMIMSAGLVMPEWKLAKSATNSSLN